MTGIKVLKSGSIFLQKMSKNVLLNLRGKGRPGFLMKKTWVATWKDKEIVNFSKKSLKFNNFVKKSMIFEEFC